MLSRTRILPFVTSIIIVLFFAALLVYAPPDGQERGDVGQFIGRFHPLVVHLPIALLLLVPVLEYVGLIRRWNYLRESSEFVLALAGASAMAAVSLGWLLARTGGYEGRLVTRHMWGGLFLTFAVLVCCMLRRWNRNVYGVAVFATLGLLIWVSDQGGKLTHGETFLTQHMPGELRAMLRLPAPAKKVHPSAEPAITTTTHDNVQITPSVTFYAARVAPILSDKCVLCHNAEKRKGKLRLDDFEYVMRGGKDGVVVVPGEAKRSELFRRINLSPEDKDFMPADGKPPLTAAEIKVIELWIDAGASNSLPAVEVRGVPPLPSRNLAVPFTRDYRMQLKVIAKLEEELGVRLVPRSQNPTDGLILRTVSAPERCDNAALAGMKPIADLIVDMELARTKVTDSGLRTLSAFSKLRSLDLSHTAVTSTGVHFLDRLENLETLNLTGTAVDDNGVSELRHKPKLKHLYLFETKCTVPSERQTRAGKR